MTRILLVEDDEVQRNLLGAVLTEALGKGACTLQYADRLSRALVLSRQDPFDAVLLDLTLPDCEGFETVRITTTEAPDAAIIVLTSTDDDELATRAIRQGAQDFITKGHVAVSSLARCIRFAIERHRHVLELRDAALRDDLTGLLNRRGFMVLAWHQLKVATRTKRPMTMLFFDVDGMKQINDSLGHHHGDAALVKVANVLGTRFRDCDIVGRVGGDEFCALLVDDEGDLDRLSRVRSALAELGAGDRLPHRLSVSMGIVQYDADHPSSVEELIERADEAMYRDKRGDRDA